MLRSIGGQIFSLSGYEDGGDLPKQAIDDWIEKPRQAGVMIMIGVYVKNSENSEMTIKRGHRQQCMSGIVTVVDRSYPRSLKGTRMQTT